MNPIKLKILRESAGYKSQQAFADAFGVAQSTVGGWESGKREPDHETTARLADFFQVPVDFLISDNNVSYAIDRSGKYILAQDPLSVLKAQYHISSDVFARIADTDRSTVDNWFSGKEKPSDHHYDKIADFFKIDAADLKHGRIPLYTSNDVQIKVYGETGMRYDEYRNRNEVTKDDLVAAFFGDVSQLSKEDVDQMWDDVKDYAEYKLAQKQGETSRKETQKKD